MSSFLENVENWQQKADHGEIKYYKPPKELNQILSGRLPLILGRKGTGKSALLNYLEETRKNDDFVIRIEFNPVRLKGWGVDQNGNRLTPEHYEVLWSAFLYQTICREAVKRSAIMGRLKDEVSIRHAVDSHTSIGKSVRKLGQTIRRLSVTFSGVEIENGASPRELPKYPRDQDWLNFTESCRSDALSVARQCKGKVIALFDEIDLHAHQPDRLRAADYLNCVGGLLRATAQISIGKGQETTIQPIVALRSDIFSMLDQPELNAWNGKTLELVADPEYLRDILRHRISKALGNNSEELSFSKAWSAAFYDDVVADGEESLDSFERIQDRTLNRTRDLVEYMRLAAKYQRQRKDSKSTRLTSQSFLDAYLDFANFFLNEFKDEIIFKYDYGRHIISALRFIYQSHPARGNFQMAEFVDALREEGVTDSDQNLRDLIRDLYQTSALGFQNKTDTGGWTGSTFKHVDPNSKLPAQFWNSNTAFVLHRGFRRALIAN